MDCFSFIQSAVIREACNRAYALGARCCYVDSGQDFYAAIGFDRRWRSAIREKPTQGHKPIGYRL